MSNIPVQAIIKEVEVPVQQMIVNGEVKEIKAKAYSLCCSSCGRVIYSFNPGERYTDVYQAIMESKEDLAKHFGYCPECGETLRYDFDIFDGEIVNE